MGTKNVDIKNRVVDLYDVDTGQIEDEILSYIKRDMKVRIYSAVFTNKKYVFTGKPEQATSNAITITGYRKKSANETTSIEIQ